MRRITLLLLGIALSGAELSAQIGLHTGEADNPAARSCEMRIKALTSQVTAIANRVLSLTSESIAENKAIYGDIERLRRERLALSRKMSACRPPACTQMLESQARGLDSRITALERQAQRNLQNRLDMLNNQRNNLERMASSLMASPDCMAPQQATPGRSRAPTAAAEKVPATEAEEKTPIKRAVDIKNNTKEEDARKLDCSGLIGKIYPELARDKMIKEIKDCPIGAKGCECAPQARPCSRSSQKQYEYLRRQGRIEQDITKIENGDVLFLKESDLIAHVVLLKNKKPDEDGECTEAYCPVKAIYTSAGDPIKDGRLLFEGRCYSWCTIGKRSFNRETKKYECRHGRLREQCFVGGGAP